MPFGIIEPGGAIRDEVNEEVHGAVEEREQPEHPPEADRAVPAGEPPERRDRERDAEKPQRPDAGLVGDVLERVRAEIAGGDGPDEPGETGRARQETPPA